MIESSLGTPLRVVLNGDQPRPALLPKDVTIATFNPNHDARGLYRAHRACHPDAEPDLADWWSERVDDPRSPFEPSLWLVARLDRVVVGFVVATPRPFRGRDVAALRDLGVVAEHRRRGIGAALITRLFIAAESEGLAVVTATALSEESAGLFRATGFTPRSKSEHRFT
ncbi:hypothetical protein Afil01_59600 [Actinorhabdospora filicis]|uniref:N-acetyltransferase domain-containing protein n=1 Tax=Actinorhabdospora filicis TaxID=1785913 RepID=A0A9W6SRR8_9ACTN|nr:GNAT family N-acetyltransferase [Actinorhabdospora filicis]GLZ81153.1 hypothetical protein Afil01_59600 [Actinorhabdospora filicis]